METRDILIIDDDKDLTRSMQAILKEHDYNVDVANDTETGMAKFNARKPDLLILDVMMASELEGHKLAHTIKSDPNNKDLPILVITGMMDTMGVNIRDAFEGIDDLPNVVMLDKPFETEELLSRMEQMIAGTLEE
ncbi:MAG: response regulator [Bacteroidales bacterium]|nr:response regulator [Bacteroidales bacterium]